MNEGERAENKYPNNTDMQSKNYPEPVIQDEHTHTPVTDYKQKDLPEDAEKEQKADIKDADKLQRNTSGNPWEKPSENKNTVKKIHND